jgi:GT2 family glycosyltransferase
MSVSRIDAFAEADTNNLPIVSIITANWNGARRLRAFLADLSALNYPKEELELIIHDNASTDGSQRLITDEFDAMKAEGWRRLHLINALVHPGLNRAYVNAYAHTSGNSEFILEIDNDVRLAPDALKRLVFTMRNNPNAAVVGCNVRYAVPPYEQNCGAIFYDWWFNKDQRKDLADVSRCDAILDCVMLLRRNTLNAVEVYFDPDYYFFCLGSDLFMRLKKKGWDILYDPKAVAYHDAGYSTSRHSDLTTYLCVRDNVVFHMNHNQMYRFPVIQLRTLISACKHLVLHRDSTRFRAMIDGLRRKPFDLNWWQDQLKAR